MPKKKKNSPADPNVVLTSALFVACQTAVDSKAGGPLTTAFGMADAILRDAVRSAVAEHTAACEKLQVSLEAATGEAESLQRVLTSMDADSDNEPDPPADDDT